MRNVHESDVAIFSIKPVYAAKILSGDKKVEYRKCKCNRNIKKILIYATAPIKMVIGEVSVNGILSDDPNKVWDLTHDDGGILKLEFDIYFLHKNVAFAYRLVDPIKYEKPHSLSEYGIERPPQSFCYIKK